MGIANAAGRLTLNPPSISAQGGLPQTLTAQWLDAGNAPLANVAVSFTVVSGPNAGRTGEAVTDTLGNARFTYTSEAQGGDVVEARVVNGVGETVRSGQSTVTWITPGCVATPGSGGSAGSTGLSYIGATGGQVSDPVQLAALLVSGTGAPLAGRTVTFTFGQTPAPSGITDANGVARATVTPGSAGVVSVQAAFAGDTVNGPAAGSASVTVEREDAVLRYTGKTLLGTAAAQTVTARLTDADSGSALSGRPVTFQVGGVTATGTTDASGVATAQVTLPASAAALPQTVTVRFAGDAMYKPAMQGVPVRVYLLTSFVVWGANNAGLKLGDRVNFWGAQWDKQVKQGSYGGNSSFKGYGDPVTSVAICQPNANKNTVTPGCWESKGGNSFPPPLTVPNLIQVIVSTAIDKRGPDHIGNIKASAVVEVEPGYGTAPGKEGWGKLIAVIEDAGVFPAPASLTLSMSQAAKVLPGQAVTVTGTVVNGSTATGATGATLASAFDGMSPAAGSFGFGNVPQIAGRSGAETSGEYVARLGGLDGRLYTSTGTLSYSDGAGQIYAPVTVSASSVLEIPVLTVSLHGPAVVPAGGTVPYAVTVANIGSGAAASATVALRLPNGNVESIPVPALAAGSSAVVSRNYTHAAVGPKGANETTAAYLARLAAADGVSLSAEAKVTWRDGLSNNYGEVEAKAFTSTVRVPVVNVSVSGLPTSALPGAELTLNVTAQKTGGCTATATSATVTKPDNSNEVLSLGPLAPGGTATVTAKYVIPGLPGRDDFATDALYVAALQALSNKNTVFNAAVTWSDPAGSSANASSAPDGVGTSWSTLRIVSPIPRQHAILQAAKAKLIGSIKQTA